MSWAGDPELIAAGGHRRDTARRGRLVRLWSALRPRFRARIAPRVLGLLVFGWLTFAPGSASAQSFCESCEVSGGAGGTYHFWATTGSLVLPVTVTWSESHYEFGVFRFTDQQLIPLPGTHRERRMAGPYWGTSLSRRWQLFERGPVRGLAGFGLAARAASDELSVTRWDFASQLALQVRLPGNRAISEVTMRHWSNGGLKLPNHGQDFATLTIRLNSGLFGLGQEEQFPIDPSFSLHGPVSTDDPEWEGTGLP